MIYWYTKTLVLFPVRTFDIQLEFSPARVINLRILASSQNRAGYRLNGNTDTMMDLHVKVVARYLVSTFGERV